MSLNGYVSTSCQYINTPINIKSVNNGVRHGRSSRLQLENLKVYNVRVCDLFNFDVTEGVAKSNKIIFFRVQNFFLFSCIVPVFVMSDNLCLFLAVNGCKFCKCCSQTKTQGKQVLSDEEAGFECIEENLLDSLQEVSVDSFGHYISINDNKSKNKHIKSRHQNNSVSSVQNQIWQLR